jgi:hypothetical protein
MEGRSLLSGLSRFKNRQVIVNRYEDEELVSKEGYTFEEATVLPERIVFRKDDRVVLVLDIPEQASVSKPGMFPNHYVLAWNNERLEIYFP